MPTPKGVVIGAIDALAHGGADAPVLVLATGETLQEAADSLLQVAHAAVALLYDAVTHGCGSEGERLATVHAWMRRLADEQRAERTASDLDQRRN